jgi:hypothetical protein
MLLSSSLFLHVILLYFWSVHVYMDALPWFSLDLVWQINIYTLEHILIKNRREKRSKNRYINFPASPTSPVNLQNIHNIFFKSTSKKPSNSINKIKSISTYPNKKRSRKIFSFNRIQNKIPHHFNKFLLTTTVRVTMDFV